MDIDANLDRARTLVNLGCTPDAIELVDACLAAEPDNPDVLVARAELALLADDPVTAHRAALSAVDNDPDPGARTVEVLAVTSLAAGRLDDAVAAAHRAVETDPDDAGAHALLAMCLSVGAVTAAERRAVVAAIDRVLTLAPDNAGVLLEAARAAERIHDHRLAATLAATGLRADPGNVDLRTMQALDEPLTGTKAAALVGILAGAPTDRRTRHALAEVVWAAVARLASGVWVYALVVLLASAWVPPETMTHLAPLAGALLIVGWTGLFHRTRKRLPRGYLSKRLWRSPSAATGVLVAMLALVVAVFSTLLITVAFDADGVRAGYLGLIVGCLVAGLAHLLVTLGWIRPGGDVDLAAHVHDQTGNWFVWLLGLGLPIGVGWLFHGFAGRPGALWAALALLPIVLAVVGLEITIKAWRQSASRRSALVGVAAWLAFAVVSGWLVSVCAGETRAADFPDARSCCPERPAPRVRPPSSDLDLPSRSTLPRQPPG